MCLCVCAVCVCANLCVCVCIQLFLMLSDQITNLGWILAYLFIFSALFSLFLFLSDVPWLFYQDAEYLFHTFASEWSNFGFVCSWLHSDLLTIHSAHEQEFIHSKIKAVLEHNSPQKIQSLAPSFALRTEGGMVFSVWLRIFI